MQPEIVIFCLGNPARGDDAIGAVLFERLERIPGNFDLYFEFQLGIEHALELEGRDCAFFVDASVNVGGPFEMKEIFPKIEFAHSTHILAPEALLGIYRDVMKRNPPKSYLLGVKGQSFRLGEPLSIEAASNLEHAWCFLKDFIGLKCGFGKAAIPG